MTEDELWALALQARPLVEALCAEESTALHEMLAINWEVYSLGQNLFMPREECAARLEAAKAAQGKAKARYEVRLAAWDYVLHGPSATALTEATE